MREHEENKENIEHIEPQPEGCRFLRNANPNPVALRARAFLWFEAFHKNK